jgi:ABC-2 type transport system permease protein
MTVTAVGAPPASDVGSGTSFAGTWRLVRFALRRDRWKMPAWILAIVVTLVATAASFPELYTDAASRQARAALMGSPAAVAMGGPEIGVADYTFGAMMTNEMLLWVAAFVALMSIFAVMRHTRGEEESGRTELLLGRAVGRYAPLAAAVVVAVIANLVLAVLIAVGLGSLGLESMGWGGSWLYGAACASVGLVFAGVAAVTAQLFEHARSASGIAGLTLGIAIAARAVGDVTETPVSWLSPIAWAQRTYAYVEDRWWPLLLSLALTGGLIALAVVLRTRRDLGAGMRQPSPGPGSASAALRTPLGLAARLQRSSLIAWAASFLGFGLLYGTLMGQVEGFANEFEAVRPLFESMGSELMVAFQSMLVLLLSMAASVFAIMATLRLRSEEHAGTGEAVLATPVSRAEWVGTHATVAAAGSVAILFAGALGLGISGASVLGDLSVLTNVLSGACVQVAALLLVVGLTVTLFGWAPRIASVVWLVVVYAMFVGTFGGLLGLPEWAIDLSPFTLVPLLPGEDFGVIPIVTMVLVAAALYALGIAGLRRRDLQTTS